MRRSLVVVLFAAAACATGGDQRPTAPPPPPPPPATTASIRVRVFPLDDGAPPAFAVTMARTGGAGDAAVGEAGKAATLIAPIGEPVQLTIAPVGAADYFPSAASLSVTRDTTLDVVLVPRSWTVRSGLYAGVRQPIDIVEAFGSDADDTHFLDYFTVTPTALLGWRPSDFPIRVGFDTSDGPRRWTANDSTTWWHYLDDINTIMGEPLFRPTGDVATGTPGVIALHLDFTFKVSPAGALRAAASHLCLPPARLCGDVTGEVWLGEGYMRSYAPGQIVFSHEMMHALGFGHGCYWSSVMMHTGLVCSADVPKQMTAADVAYVELIRTLAGALEAHPRAWHLVESLAGARAAK